MERVAVTSLVLLSFLLAAPDAPPARDKLRFGFDYRWWGRNLSYRGVDPTFATTTVGPQPTGVTLDAQWFPAAYFVDDRGADVGIFMRVDMAPDYVARVGEARFVASAFQLRTGLLFRLPFRYAEPSIHAGLHVFEATTSPFASDGTRRPKVPNVSYQGPRLGLAVRLLEFWRITFDVAGGATWLLGLGEFDSARFFPGASGSAFDLKAGLAFRTWTWLDVRLGVDVTVHALTMPGGATATDAYYGVSLGFIFKGLP